MRLGEVTKNLIPLLQTFPAYKVLNCECGMTF